jgi:putative membrane protein
MKNLQALVMAVAAGAFLLGAASMDAGADKAATATTAKTTAVASADSGFIKEAADQSVGEVEMARLGADKAASNDVKQFAQKLVDDHTKANGEPTSLAGTKSVDIAEKSDKHRKMMDKLADKAGVDFDIAFMKQMVSDHKKVVREFDHEAKSGKDPDVKAWAEKTLPTLREHLQEAETIYSGLKGTSTTPAGTRSTAKTSN